MLSEKQIRQILNYLTKDSIFELGNGLGYDMPSSRNTKEILISNIIDIRTTENRILRQITKYDLQTICSTLNIIYEGLVKEQLIKEIQLYFLELNKSPEMKEASIAPKPPVKVKEIEVKAVEKKTNNVTEAVKLNSNNSILSKENVINIINKAKLDSNHLQNEKEPAFTNELFKTLQLSFPNTHEKYKTGGLYNLEIDINVSDKSNTKLIGIEVKFFKSLIAYKDFQRMLGQIVIYKYDRYSNNDLIVVILCYRNEYDKQQQMINYIKGFIERLGGIPVFKIVN